ncbi:zf-C2H2 Zinc finger, C2H2 type [Pseudozyma hubeiensis SY62]|uniref:Zf-C2H2 Zinc finger, C2H2 type n=1 Tax=Pseudozyma hubeiensis (strain SY62) TaxID=1305764 RepID=R9P901_PSEHS|nr:zf-C2H2 Zinc finger, C2H2 type [Pseudozyma hubeiensis SY62]GAC97848.1 zf-C2H2 Zinc finger, C2H2 type [Pseudozyma hubeiensis SY62]
MEEKRKDAYVAELSKGVANRSTIASRPVLHRAELTCDEQPRSHNSQAAFLLFLVVESERFGDNAASEAARRGRTTGLSPTDTTIINMLSPLIDSLYQSQRKFALIHKNMSRDGAIRGPLCVCSNRPVKALLQLG